MSFVIVHSIGSSSHIWSSMRMPTSYLSGGRLSDTCSVIDLFDCTLFVMILSSCFRIESFRQIKQKGVMVFRFQRCSLNDRCHLCIFSFPCFDLLHNASFCCWFFFQYALYDFITNKNEVNIEYWYFSMLVTQVQIIHTSVAIQCLDPVRQNPIGFVDLENA